MSPLNLVDSLKQAAKSNATLRDVLLLLATRQRARFQITLKALSIRMKREKFNHTEGEYAKCLEILATLGIGTLDLDSKGRVRGLKDLKYRIPQLGQAVIDKADLISFKRKPQYQAIYEPVESKLPSRQIKVPVAKSNSAPSGFVSLAPSVARDLLDRRSGQDRRERSTRSYQTPGTKLVLTYILNDKPINIPVPSNLTPSELVTLVKKLSGETVTRATTIDTTPHDDVAPKKLEA